MLKKAFAGLDYWLIGAVCLLSIFGIICIGSATHINLGEDLSDFYSQALWFLIGFILMIFTANINLKKVSDYWVFVYVFNIILLVSVFFIGTSKGVASRWIRVGDFGIQPSEISKVMMIFCLAKFIDKKRCRVDNIKVGLSIILLVLLPFFIILKQPSLSAALVLLAISGVMIFASGIKYSSVLKVTGAVLAAVIFIIKDILSEKPVIADKLFRGYQLDRVLAWINPEMYSDTYYQTEKSLNAIGSGQLWGMGLFKGQLTQLNYLPEPHNDFIFSVIGEEFGFIGCMAVICLMLFIIYRCILAGLSAENNFYSLISAGVSGMFCFQAAVNIGVATGVFPNTGMAFPFVSYGGSSMITCMIGIGLILNIGKQKSKSLFGRRLL